MEDKIPFLGGDKNPEELLFRIFYRLSLLFLFYLPVRRGAYADYNGLDVAGVEEAERL